MRVESLGYEIVWIWLYSLLEEKSCECKAIIQCNKSLADQRSYSEKPIVIHFESCVDKVRSDTPRQVLSCEEADVSPVEVIQLLKVDRGG